MVRFIWCMEAPHPEAPHPEARAMGYTAPGLSSSLMRFRGLIHNARGAGEKKSKNIFDILNKIHIKKKHFFYRYRMFVAFEGGQ